MYIRLGYGSGSVQFDVPPERVGRELRPRRPPAAPDAEAFLATELAAAFDPARADCDGRSVLVLLPDGTRTLPHRAAYAALTPLLARAASVRVRLATGTHRPDTPDNDRVLDIIRAVSAERGVPLAAAKAHDCRAGPFDLVGTTTRGNRVGLHRAVAESDAIIVVADTVPHYFAGYSNATKYLLPGVAAFDCIERNHAWALDPLASACRHPLHPDPARRANPVAEDQLEAARLVTAQRPVFALTALCGGGGVCRATFGPLEESVADGIRMVNDWLVERVEATYSRAVIGCGGYPNDETLYLAQRSLELTQEALADGAEVLWLAECRNGIASSREAIDNFFTPLKGDAAAYCRRVEKRYVMFAHKTVRFVRLMERLAAVHVVSALPSGTFPAGCMRACMIHLEEKGVLKNKFERKFRTQAPWRLPADWKKDIPTSAQRLGPGPDNDPGVVSD